MTSTAMNPVARGHARVAVWRPFASKILPLLFVALVLAGCKTDLYTKQSEVDTNDMVSALLESGIAASKETADAGKTWNVQVDQEQVVRSFTVLRSRGLPRERHVTLGEMFKKDGLISTPTEERVRFIYGVAQQLESTLSQIDGVITARVHIVLPNNDPLATVVKPASASVFLKYRQEANLAGLTPSIKNMVARSVEGLSYESVTVTLVPGTAPAPAPAPESSHVILWGALVIVLLALAGTLGWIAWKRPAWLPPALQRKRPAEPAAVGAAA